MPEDRLPDADQMKLAREIVRENLDYPALLDQITDEDDLVNAGVNSGEIIRVALGCENHLDRPLTDGELSRIASVRSVADLLAQNQNQNPGQDQDQDLAQNQNLSQDQNPSQSQSGPLPETEA